MRGKCSCAAAILMSLLLLPNVSFSQNDGEDYETWKKRAQAEYGNYKRQQQSDYENFRQKANADYAEFLKKHWEGLQAFKGIKPPEPPAPVPPVVIPEEDREKERKDDPKPYEEVVVVEPPKPQPTPVEPVAPPEPVKPKQETISTNFFGTRIECLVEKKPQFTLGSLDEESISKAWGRLSDGHCDALLSQCMKLRGRYRLSDWGYIQLLDSISSVCCKRPNEATFLMCWLYCQSGYKMRLARDNNRLYMLFASENLIYNISYFEINNELFYCYKGGEVGSSLYVCDVAFPKERTMTLKMTSEPQLKVRTSNKRTLKSKQYPALTLTTTVNQNLIDFYSNYPTGSINEDFGTRWAMYANTPLSEEARKAIYPRLKKLMEGKSKLKATEELLNFVQTAFVYEYDDKVWGCDRAFFAEETLFYPYADCEDRSILFSRLVRDLLGLKVVLIYYPGHLATAVHFVGEQPNGDYLELKDGKYYIADPTYIGAPVGVSMPDIREDIKNVVILK